jgi:hypothetical protein
MPTALAVSQGCLGLSIWTGYGSNAGFAGAQVAG